LPYPPKWGRLGDEVYDDCGSVWRIAGFGEWEEITDYGDWDASQEFVIGPPTAGKETRWGTIRTLYR
jgi:hypothetical protein